MQIGSYYSFKSDGLLFWLVQTSQLDSLTLKSTYVDEDIYNDTKRLSDGVFCLLPLAFVVGTIAAFATGRNRAWAWASSLSLMVIILVPLRVPDLGLSVASEVEGEHGAILVRHAG